jgi:hypothetical protein
MEKEANSRKLYGSGARRNQVSKLDQAGLQMTQAA